MLSQREEGDGPARGDVQDAEGSRRFRRALLREARSDRKTDARLRKYEVSQGPVADPFRPVRLSSGRSSPLRRCRRHPERSRERGGAGGGRGPAEFRHGRPGHPHLRHPSRLSRGMSRVCAAWIAPTENCHPLMSGDSRRGRVFPRSAGGAVRFEKTVEAAWALRQVLLRRLIDLLRVGWLPPDQGSSRGWLALSASMGKDRSGMTARVPLTCGLSPGRCSVDYEWKLSFRGSRKSWG